MDQTQLRVSAETVWGYAQRGELTDAIPLLPLVPKSDQHAQQLCWHVCTQLSTPEIARLFLAHFDEMPIRDALAFVETIAAKFPGAYLQYLGRSASSYGSWALFKQVVQKPQVVFTRDALVGALRYVADRFTYEKEVRREALLLLAGPIASLPNVKDRTQLFQCSIRVVPTPPKRLDRKLTQFAWRPKIQLDEIPATPEELKQLQQHGLLARIQRHAEQRAVFFYELCCAVYGDGREYRVRGPLYTYAIRPKPPGGGLHRCHSATLSAVERREEGIWWDSQAFAELPFAQRLGHAVWLPKEFNKFDGDIDGDNSRHWLLRTDAMELVRAVAREELLPNQALDAYSAAYVKYGTDWLVKAKEDPKSGLVCLYAAIQMRVLGSFRRGTEDACHDQLVQGYGQRFLGSQDWTGPDPKSYARLRNALLKEGS